VTGILVAVFLPSLLDIRRWRLYVDTFYWFFGVGRLHPNYADLRGTLAAIESVDQVGQSFTIQCESFDEPCLGWGWSYGSTILKTPDFLIISQEKAWVLAILFFLCVVYVLLKVEGSLLYRSMLIFILPSGTFLLAFERMNIDILTIPLVYMLARTRVNGLLYSLCALSFLTLFTLTKYYTMPLFILFILLRKSLILRITASVMLLFSIKVVIQDILSAGLDKYGFGYSATLGLKNLVGLITGSDEPSLLHRPITLFVLILFFLILISYFLRLLETLTPTNSHLSNFKFELFLFSFGILFPAWVSGSSYPYRMVVLVLTFPYISSILKQIKPLCALFLSLSVASFFLLQVTIAFSRNLFFSILIMMMLSILINSVRRGELLPPS
jgi:hypothetical protein